MPDNGTLLLAPPVPSRYKPDKPLKVILTVPPKYKTDKRAGCTVQEGNFALLPQANKHHNTLVLMLPALQNWQTLLNTAAQNVTASEYLQSSLNHFIDGVGRLADRGCLPPGIGEPLRALILQTIPLSPQQSLYNFYEYWIGNGTVDLIPHLRLKIQRAYFAQNADSKSHLVGPYLGTSTIYYGVQQTPSGLFRLNKGQLKTDTIASRGRFVMDESDNNLVEFVKPMPVHRLILFTQFVSQQVQRPALILSANTSKALNKATASLQAEPTKSCPQIEKEEQVGCIPFFGNVTVSPEIEIFENGHSKYVAFGTTLDTLVQEDTFSSHRLRLLRLFSQEYAEVKLPTETTALPKLTLIGGDKIVWK